MLRPVPDVLLVRAVEVCHVRAQEVLAVLPRPHQTKAGVEFCAWVRTGPIFHRCFVCNRSVPFEMCKATTICYPCARNGPPVNKALII